jgi:5'-3' exonuclease
MVTNLIIDGNFLLNRLVFTLVKDNLLYGALERSLYSSFETYTRLYPFKKVFFVSDEKSSSWRKEFYQSYKSTRKKNTEVDWEFVYDIYEQFKKGVVSRRNIVLTGQEIEGDDWIGYCISKTNSLGESNFIITNDHDVCQHICMSLEPLYVNVFTNDLYSGRKFFVPQNLSLFEQQLEMQGNDLFDMNDNNEFLTLLSTYKQISTVVEVDPVRSLVEKIISGDSGDDVPSVYRKKMANGNYRGIGAAGAVKLYDKYLEEFGEPDIDGEDFAENIADLVCEDKKLSKSEMDPIRKNVMANMKLVRLDPHIFPERIQERMENIWKRSFEHGL